MLLTGNIILAMVNKVILLEIAYHRAQKIGKRLRFGIKYPLKPKLVLHHDD